MQRNTDKEKQIYKIGHVEGVIRTAKKAQMAFERKTWDDMHLAGTRFSGESHVSYLWGFGMDITYEGNG